MKKLITILAAGATLCACSPAQTRAWLRWHRQEPAAAEAWAKDECGALCTDDWDRDGVVEPEPVAAPAPSDDSENSTDSGSQPAAESEPNTSGGMATAPTRCSRPSRAPPA